MVDASGAQGLPADILRHERLGIVEPRGVARLGGRARPLDPSLPIPSARRAGLGAGALCAQGSASLRRERFSCYGVQSRGWRVNSGQGPSRRAQEPGSIRGRSPRSRHVAASQAVRGTPTKPGRLRAKRLISSHGALRPWVSSWASEYRSGILWPGLVHDGSPARSPVAHHRHADALAQPMSGRGSKLQRPLTCVVAGQGPPGGSPGWTRTSNPSVNSRMLCQLSYRGSIAPGKVSNTLLGLLNRWRPRPGLISARTLRRRRGPRRARPPRPRRPRGPPGRFRRRTRASTAPDRPRGPGARSP